jgi:hypothetical protein
MKIRDWVAGDFYGIYGKVGQLAGSSGKGFDSKVFGFRGMGYEATEKNAKEK